MILRQIPMRFIHYDKQRSCDSALALVASPKQSLVDDVENRTYQVIQNRAGYPREVQYCDRLAVSDPSLKKLWQVFRRNAIEIRLPLAWVQQEIELTIQQSRTHLIQPPSDAEDILLI